MKKIRRIIAGALIVLGGVLLLMAPETRGGIVLIGIALLVEVVGVALERRD